MKYIFKIASIGLMTFLTHSCATFDKQITNKLSVKADDLGTNIYLIGDAGFLEKGESSNSLKGLSEKIQNSKKEDVLLFLGDNIYQKGMPVDKTDVNRLEAEKSLQAQINVAQKFNGKVIFIPGNHDWYSGIEGLKEEKKIVENNVVLSSNAIPNNF